MKSTLRPYHQLVIILLILLIHGGMLMTFVLIQFQSDSLNMPPQEALVTIEEESQNEVMEPQPLDFVSITQGITNSEQLNQQSTEEVSQAADQKNDPTKKPEKEIEENQLDNALDFASHVLGDSSLKNLDAIKNALDTNPPSDSTKKIPTLAQLTKGFEEHIQQANLGVISESKGVASIEQIKYLNYAKKIVDCISSSLRINRNLLPHKTPEQSLQIILALNQNGEIIKLTVQQTSGDPAVDQFFIEMFKDASSSFPPMPSSIKDPFFLPLEYDPTQPPSPRGYISFKRS